MSERLREPDLEPREESGSAFARLRAGENPSISRFAIGIAAVAAALILLQVYLLF